MIYGKVVDGKIEYAPPEFYTDDNEVIMDIDVMEQFGYKMVINVKPEYEKGLYKLYYIGFTELDYAIRLHYEVRKVVSVEKLDEIYTDEINKL